MPLHKQLANIGGEVYRAVKFKNQNNERWKIHFDTALELTDLSIELLDGTQNLFKLQELRTSREVLYAHFYANNENLVLNEKLLQKYYDDFALI